MTTSTLAELETTDVEQTGFKLDTEPYEHYEIVDDQLIEEPPLGARENWITSKIASALAVFGAGKAIGQEVQEMLFILADEPRLRRRPDLAFVSAARWPVDRPAPSAAAWNVVPDLAVEVVSPADPVEDLLAKIEEYFRAGVRLLWVVHPNVQKLYAYESPKAVQILDAGDALSGGEVLPGFELSLSRIFVADPPEPSQTGS